MSRLNTTSRANVDPDVSLWNKQVAQQVNALSEGRLVATYNAYTSFPTTGTWAVGDYIKNSAPAELGTALNKYVILGWVCTVAGTPGTWLQTRTLTGN